MPASTTNEPRKLAGLVAGLATVLALMTLLFGLPAVNSGPHDLPIGVAGPAAAVSEVERALEQAAPGDYEETRYPDEASLRAAIEERDEVGGIVAGQSPTVLVASAGGTVIAQNLRGLAEGLGRQTGAEVAVDDVVPTTADDPAGAGIGAIGLPLILGGLLPAVALTKLLRRRSLRIGGALAFAAVAGLTVAALLQFVLGTTDANFLLVAGGLALGMAAISMFALGMESLLGDVGFALTAVAVVLLGNPLSGISTSPAWLPEGWGALGQLLPPGATGTVLRSNAFFDGHGAGVAALVLTAWLVAGLALSALAATRRDGAAPSAAAS